jgi:DNA processing protein
MTAHITRTGGDDDRLARIALTWLAEPGNRAVHTMVRTGGAVATLERLLRGDVPDAALRAAVIARTASGDPRRLGQAALHRAERLGARVVVPGDEEWPTIVDTLTRLELPKPGRVDRDTRPPLCLWARGPWSLQDAFDRSVAVVGARAATGYGVHVATDIAFGLAEREWTVVSGGAYGIDAATHRAALAAGGVTAAILACGVDRPYPMGNAALFDQIAERGLLVSEWPPGAEPLRHRFLIRNRVIAAATAGTVLVEAAARSGATQTMGRVLALGRHAMVVPGPVTSAMSVGCHELLRSDPHTRVVTGLAHVLDLVGRIGADMAAPPRGAERPRDGLDEESALVLEAMPGRGTVGPEQLAARAGLDLRVVLRRLSLLETAGLLVRRDGGVALPPRPGPRRPTSATTHPTPGDTAVQDSVRPAEDEQAVGGPPT